MIATSGSSSSVFFPTTYTEKTSRVTYFTTGNNSWYPTPNSWKCEDIGIKYLLMKPSINVYCVYTRLMSSVSINLATGTSTNGEYIVLNDAGGYANQSNIIVTCSNSDLFEGNNSTYTLNSAYAYKRLLYSGPGSSGYFLFI